MSSISPDRERDLGQGTREDFQISPLEKFENFHVHITK